MSRKSRLLKEKKKQTCELIYSHLPLRQPYLGTGTTARSDGGLNDGLINHLLGGRSVAGAAGGPSEERERRLCRAADGSATA